MAHRPQDALKVADAIDFADRQAAIAAGDTGRRALQTNAGSFELVDDDVTEADITSFADLLTVDEDTTDRRRKLSSRLRHDGVSPSEIVLSLFVPAARLLGTRWLDDVITFMDVTSAMHRLTLDLIDLERCSPWPVAVQGGEILLAPASDDQHGFGIAVMGFLLRRDGWSVSSQVDGARDAILAAVRARHFDAVGFSVGHHRCFDDLAMTIDAVRATSSNPDVVIAVGGPVVCEHPERVRSLRADYAGADAAEALTFLQQIRPDRLATIAGPF